VGACPARAVIQRQLDYPPRCSDLEQHLKTSHGCVPCHALPGIVLPASAAAAAAPRNVGILPQTSALRRQLQSCHQQLRRLRFDGRSHHQIMRLYDNISCHIALPLLQFRPGRMSVCCNRSQADGEVSSHVSCHHWHARH
jgi:hypothetical protein